MKLTSLDFSLLLSWIAYYKYNRILNKTQMQKLLFFCYGVWYGVKNSPLFTDDTPKAWPFGPVFPRVNKRYNPEIQPTAELPSDIKAYLIHHPELLCLFINVVEILGKKSAGELTEWSHQIGGPWSKTIYGANLDNKDIVWNKPIPLDYIKDFFKNYSEWLKREKL